MSRSSFYYQTKKDYNDLMGALSKKAQDYPTEGFWKANRGLGMEGYNWSFKRVHRVYCLM
jgi:hypothetical protein